MFYFSSNSRYITGERGEAKKILLPREIITWDMPDKACLACFLNHLCMFHPVISSIYELFMNIYY